VYPVRLNPWLGAEEVGNTHSVKEGLSREQTSTGEHEVRPARGSGVAAAIKVAHRGVEPLPPP
jgi:hypothetical protein